MSWYYVENGEQRGPVSEEQLQSLVTQGAVTAETLVWATGMKDWAPVATAAPQLLGADAAPASPALDPTADLMGDLGSPDLLADLGLGGGSGGAAGLGLFGELMCCSCGRSVSADQAIEIEGKHVCAECKPGFVQRLKEGIPVLTGGDLNYAGFWIRWVAVVIDGFVLFPLNIGIGVVVGVAAVSTGDEAAAAGLQLLSWVLTTGLGVLYETLLVGRFGATVGKMAVGLRVVTADGDRVGYLRAFARYWAKMLSAIILMIGYIMAAFDSEKRALHDHICGTRVVRR